MGPDGLDLDLSGKDGAGGGNGGGGNTGDDSDSGAAGAKGAAAQGGRFAPFVSGASQELVDGENHTGATLQEPQGIRGSIRRWEQTLPTALLGERRADSAPGLKYPAP